MSENGFELELLHQIKGRLTYIAVLLTLFVLFDLMVFVFGIAFFEEFIREWLRLYRLDVFSGN